MTKQNPVAGATPSDGRRSVPLLVFSCVLVLGVTAASFALLQTDDRVDEADRVALVPAATPGDDAFLSDLDLASAEDAQPGLDGITDLVSTLPPFEGGQTTDTTSLAGLEVRGTAEGLYSGHRRTPVCDVDGLVQGLAPSGGDDGGDSSGGDGSGDGGSGDGSDSGGGDSSGGDGDQDSGGDGSGGDGSGDQDSGDGGSDDGGSDQPSARAAAWADAAGLDAPGAIAEHVSGLTAVRLRLDTRVTSHGFRDGEATPQQALLQAGTAVLVNRTGAPRVRCADGNPLTAPEPRGDDVTGDRALDVAAVARDPDRAWAALDPSRAATVVPASEPAEQMRIIDIAEEVVLERPAGSNGRDDVGPGDLQATLRWDGRADLDLRVTDPNGAVISSGNLAPANSGGRLAEDANVQCEDNMTGTETISWPEGDAPTGEYTVTVRGHAVGDPYRADCGGNEPEFTLTIQRFGEDDVVHTETITDQSTKDFTVTLEQS